MGGGGREGGGERGGRRKREEGGGGRERKEEEGGRKERGVGKVGGGEGGRIDKRRKGGREGGREGGGGEAKGTNAHGNSLPTGVPEEVSGEHEALRPPEDRDRLLQRGAGVLVPARLPERAGVEGGPPPNGGESDWGGVRGQCEWLVVVVQGEHVWVSWIIGLMVCRISLSSPPPSSET